MRPWRILALFALFLSPLHSAPTTIPITLAPTTIPPGGTAQLQFFLTAPQTLLTGGAVITLDPAIFDNITAADVYSATGDQYGAASIQGRTVDIEFNSPTGGVGRVLSLPVLTITVPVLATAKPGAISTPTIKSGSNAWTDIQGYQYSMTLAPGALIVGGSLSISTIQPLGTLLPAETVVTISGTGFTPATTVAIDSVALSATTYISPQQISVTLAAPAGLEFHRIQLQDPTSPPVQFFPVLHSSPVAVQPIFPLQLYGNAIIGCGCPYQATGAIALQNPTQAPIDVTIFGYGLHSPIASPFTVTIQPGATWFRGDIYVEYSVEYALPTSPLRMLTTSLNTASNSYPLPPVVSASPAQSFVLPQPQISIYGAGVDTSIPIPVQANVGGPSPPPTLLDVTSAFPASFTVAAATASGGQWLSVSPQQGQACIGDFTASVPCPNNSQVTVSVDSSKLAAGTYNGTLTFSAPGAQPQIVTTVLTVYAAPEISLGSFVAFQNAIQINPTQKPYSYGISVVSTSDPVPITVTSSTASGEKWFSISTDQGHTPAVLTITITPSLFTLGTDTATLTITGPTNTLTVTYVATYQAPSTPTLPTVTASLQTLQFVAFTNQPPPAAQSFTTYPSGTATVTTQSGGAWLSASPTTKNSLPAFNVKVNQAGLAPGTYYGIITISAPGFSPLAVPVTLIVASSVPPLTVSPTALSITGVHGNSYVLELLHVVTGTFPLPLTVSSEPSGFGSWLTASPANMPNDPGEIYVTATPQNLTPGTYTGSVTISSPNTNSATIPVTLTVTPAPQPPPPSGTVPLITTILDAASQNPGPLAPGEIVTLFGQNFPTTSTAQLLIGNTPAQLLYSSPIQINAVVPAQVSGPYTTVTVQDATTAIPAGGLPTAIASPAIFTQDASGRGQASVLNQDGSLNSAANPAPRGSTVQIYATGISAATQPSLTIAGVGTPITNVTSPSPGTSLIAAQIPTFLSPGDALPILLIAGPLQSPPTATIAVQ